MDPEKPIPPVKEKKSKSKGSPLVLKTPKGTRDYFPKDMAIREDMFDKIVSVFKKHGAVTIDTPVFELKDILTGKYGEDSKLIYDLQDQGGELSSLRYDLTVPFARFLAMNGTAIQNFKRYQIGKVYRRDQPAISRGRMREFYQCDFDIAGSYDPMISDAEVLRILVEILDSLQLGKYHIKINHRKILDGIFEVCGVPVEKFRTISSSIDKLDKQPWGDVRKEMVEEKGLDSEIADKIWDYVQMKGSKELVDRLKENLDLAANSSVLEGLKDMELLFEFLDIYKVSDKVSFDMSLARGLDYYTGLIFEAILEQSLDSNIVTKGMTKEEKEESTIPLGSIAAGGRYDELVGVFASASKTKKSSLKIPCVGLSIGVERIFSILSKKFAEEHIKVNQTQVLVISVRDSLLKERMEICRELWDNNISAEFMYKNKPKLQSQFNICDRDKIPLSVIIGKDEVDQGMIKIKDMTSKDAGEGGGVLIPRDKMINEIKERLMKSQS